MNIFEKTIKQIISNFGNEIHQIHIKRVLYGIHFSAVELSNNTCGVANSNLSEIKDICNARQIDTTIYGPGKISQTSVYEFLVDKYPYPLANTLKIAILNALSSKSLITPKYQILENTDPFNLIDFYNTKTICMVGAFQNYIQKILKFQHIQLDVIEKNINALTPENQYLFRAETEYKNIAPQSDVVIITGATIVNETLDNLLSCLNKKTKIIIVGPTISFIPDVLFENGVEIIGMMQITNMDQTFELLSQAASGYHLTKTCAKKITIINNASK